MFHFYREALFEYKSYIYLDNINFEIIENYLNSKNKSCNLQNQILNELEKTSYFLYKNKQNEHLKKIMKIKSSLKKNNLTKNSIENIKLQFPYLFKIIQKYFLEIEKTKNLFNNIKHTVFNSNSQYEYFLKNNYFQKTIYETNFKAYEHIINENKYTKRSFQKNRYSYIQRNILKTNSLSYSGISNFDKYSYEESKLNSKLILNMYFINALLKLLFTHPTYRNDIHFTFSPRIYRDSIKTYLQRESYIIPKYKSFHIRENLLFDKFINKILDQINEIDNLKEIENLMGKNQVNFFIKMNIINIDFKYYNIENLLKLLNKFPELDFIKRKLEYNTKSISYNKSLLYEILEPSIVENKNYLIKVLLNEPAYVNYLSNHIKFKDYEIMNHIKQFDKDKISDFIIENPKYKLYINILLNLKKQNDKKKLLDLLFDLEAKIIYQEDYWYENNDFEEYNLKLPIPKSFALFYNLNDNNEMYLNNIFPGDGFLLGREFNKMTQKAIDDLDTYLKEVHGDNEEIYELVIDYENSSAMNTGHSPYKKLYWPEDLKNIDIINENDLLKFKYHGKSIKIIYFGSMPSHLFSGVKGLMLQIITPWIMTPNIKEKIEILNKRETYELNSNEIKHLLSKNEIHNFINIIKYFNDNDLPLKFFLHIKNKPYKKPIFITLLNKDASNIFVDIIKNNEIILKELTPNITNLKNQKRLKEFITLVSWEEYNDVD
ncbi:hypothetical protein HYE69_02455 [Staphylococcus sp. GSSP0090]|nr:hypothetical protein [Staphylococcus sp. GSSP0090]